MRKKSFVLNLALEAMALMLFIPMSTFALNYTISFTGSGASTSVESVVVQNLTKGSTVTVPAGNVLNLTDVTTSLEMLSSNADGLAVYPNPMQGESTISFFAKKNGITQINIYSLDGRRVIGISRSLAQGNNSFHITIPKGAYTIQVNGNGFSYNTKAISQIISDCKAQITFSGIESQITSKPQKSKSAITTMLYSSGDQLLYKGISGNYSTIVTDKPTSDKTTNFEFVECKDADGNYYSVVKIGTQTWMAENLRTSSYRYGESIINRTDPDTWQTKIGEWCYHNNNVANNTKYGKLYNWHSISDSRNISPTSWHVASDNEWNTLMMFLGGESIAGGKLKVTGTVDWQTPNNNAANETGFSALPSGARSWNGSFWDEKLYSRWWSSTEASTVQGWSWSVGSLYGNLWRDNGYSKEWGMAVRCIKD